MAFLKKAPYRILFFKAGEILEDKLTGDFLAGSSTEAGKQFLGLVQ